jgi:hypothetical protein
MKHYQIHITILSITLIMGALVLSESTPARLFEQNVIQKIDPAILSQIAGQRTCTCPEFPCNDGIEEIKCSWTIDNYGVGKCSGCDEVILTGKEGVKIECYNDGEPDGILGCCRKECDDIGKKSGKGCPAECETVTYTRVHICSNQKTEPQCVKPCYEKQ